MIGAPHYASHHGKLMYEVYLLETTAQAGSMCRVQMGWASCTISPACLELNEDAQSSMVDGYICDVPHWEDADVHQWQPGDVIGVALDFDNGIMLLNHSDADTIRPTGQEHDRNPLTPKATCDWSEVGGQQSRQFIDKCRKESLNVYPVVSFQGVIVGLNPSFPFQLARPNEEFVPASDVDSEGLLPVYKHIHKLGGFGKVSMINESC